MTEAKSVSSSFPGFLEAGDLDGNEITATIKLVRESGEQDKGLDGKPIEKPIVVFEKARKEWVLNKTNARTIRALYGDKYEKWKGKKIILFPTSCRAFGETVACIRVREVDPETGKEPDLF
tara:strand:+ start:885 stop:1247 length:363 start_codon:yes stop_codon:yes gene_type:complete